MTTSKPRSTLARIIDSGWTTAGAVAAVPLAGAAVATGAWGWAVAAVGAVAIGTARAASSAARKPHGERVNGVSEHDGDLHTYYYLSSTRVAMIHAQLYRGRLGKELREIVRNSTTGAEVAAKVPLVGFVTKHARDVAQKYAAEITPTEETLVSDVLKGLQAGGLIHEADADLSRIAPLVSRTEANDQFLRFTVPGPDIRQAVDKIDPPVDEQQDNDGTFTVAAPGITITASIGRRGRQDDFGDLEHRDYAVVVGVLRNLNPTTRTATVRVIAVY